MTPQNDARRASERVVRDSYGRLVALLAYMSGDVVLAEDCLSDALEKALKRWPDEGVPHNPEGWLLTVARNRLRDVLASPAHRKRASLDDGIDLNPGLEPTIEAVIGGHQVFPDKRLELLFACAHPAIDQGVRTPLMLQVVLGIEASRIASAFDVKPSAMAQRLVRAKRRIGNAGLPLTIPSRSELAPRVSSVLEAIYGAYALDWLDQPEDHHTSLAEEARWLAVLTASLLKTDAEAWGLAALLTLAQARAPARVGVPWPTLERQDTTLWDRRLIDEGEALLHRAAKLSRPQDTLPSGRFQLEAAIQSVHCDRARTGVTDRKALRTLYRALCDVAPTRGALEALAAVEARGIE